MDSIPEQIKKQRMYISGSLCLTYITFSGLNNLLLRHQWYKIELLSRRKSSVSKEKIFLLNLIQASKVRLKSFALLKKNTFLVYYITIQYVKFTQNNYQ